MEARELLAVLHTWVLQHAYGNAREGSRTISLARNAGVLTHRTQAQQLLRCCWRLQGREERAAAALLLVAARQPERGAPGWNSGDCTARGKVKHRTAAPYSPALRLWTAASCASMLAALLPAWLSLSLSLSVSLSLCFLLWVAMNRRCQAMQFSLFLSLSFSLFVSKNSNRKTQANGALTILKTWTERVP